MKLEIIINKEQEEKILIICHQKSSLINRIEELVNDDRSATLIGINDDEKVIIDLKEVQCFFTEDLKVYAYVNNQKYLVKKKIYELEEILDDSFIKINQGCLANINKISKFFVSFSSSLGVLFENGYKDYVSRRQLKHVKERIGL